MKPAFFEALRSCQAKCRVPKRPTLEDTGRKLGEVLHTARELPASLSALLPNTTNGKLSGLLGLACKGCSMAVSRCPHEVQWRLISKILKRISQQQAAAHYKKSNNSPYGAGTRIAKRIIAKRSKPLRVYDEVMPLVPHI